MKVLVTGICGFVGNVLANEVPRLLEGLEVVGLDNLSRPGSERNRGTLRQQGVRLLHGDIRNPSDLESLPKIDWVIDAAANPSVLAGITSQTSSRQLMEHNLIGTINLLELCKRHGAGLVMLSTSRVYSLARLSALPMDLTDSGFRPRFGETGDPALSEKGVREDFSTQAPLSLYGCAKLASEVLALEYGLAFDFPVHVNRCGVLAGAGQFGKADQGIFSFWLHSYCRRRPLKYTGFGGTGHQVRDCLLARDLAALVALQISHPENAGKILNVSGGAANSISLTRLTEWCATRFGRYEIGRDPSPRPYDLPWLVLDSSRAAAEWNWSPVTPLDAILNEIADHAERHPEWLDLSEN
jgi:CDP-paratose 2-epimerase